MAEAQEVVFFDRKHFKKLSSVQMNKSIKIIEDAIKEGEIILKRGKELVRDTIRDTKAQLVKVMVGGGNEIEGYKLQGVRTGTNYLIDKEQLTVYREKGGKYDRRCVVDSHNKNRIFEDRLANRLVNIYNEFKKIYTLFN